MYNKSALFLFIVLMAGILVITCDGELPDETAGKTYTLALEKVDERSFTLTLGGGVFLTTHVNSVTNALSGILYFNDNQFSSGETVSVTTASIGSSYYFINNVSNGDTVVTFSLRPQMSNQEYVFLNLSGTVALDVQNVQGNSGSVEHFIKGFDRIKDKIDSVAGKTIINF